MELECSQQLGVVNTVVTINVRRSKKVILLQYFRYVLQVVCLPLSIFVGFDTDVLLGAVVIVLS